MASGTIKIFRDFYRLHLIIVNVDEFLFDPESIVTAVKSSERENKVSALNVSEPIKERSKTRKSGRIHGKAWKSGRGEVGLLVWLISTVNFCLFAPSYLIVQVSSFSAIY
jgi:hypothetical protein